MRQTLKTFDFLILPCKKVRRNWLKGDPPSPGQGLDIIKEVYSMEKLTFTLKIEAGSHKSTGEKIGRKVAERKWCPLVFFDCFFIQSFLFIY